MMRTTSGKSAPSNSVGPIITRAEIRKRANNSTVNEPLPTMRYNCTKT